MMNKDYKQDFPLLLHIDKTGRPLAYLDNAATTQKPIQVIDAVSNYYKTFNANPHRGAYSIAEMVTERFEEVREKAARLIGAKSMLEVVFTFGTTDAINLVALTYGEANVEEGDQILISITEHHSNLLPWQRLAKRKGAELVYLYPDENGRIPLAEVEEKLTDRSKIVAITHVSNVLGSVNPIREIASLAHQKGAVVVMDGAQSVPHMAVNVQELDVDFLAFSGHKMLAPAGIGILYGKASLLEEMEPLRVGGGAVEYVQRLDVQYLEAPWRFEAGTQNAEGVIGLGAAIDYLQQVGFEQIQAIERELMDYALQKIIEIPFVEVQGARKGELRTGILSFDVKDVHPHDTATILASDGVAVRAGHHCAQPLMEYLGINATCRMSLYFYNTKEDIDRLVEALRTVRGVLGYESQ